MPQKFEDLPLSQKAQVTRNMMPYVALTIMVFLRRDLGYRIVNPTFLFGASVVEIIASVIIPGGGRSKALFYFALVSFALGMYQRLKRWKEFQRGVRQHSFFIGNSRLAFPWLPAFFRRKRRVERFLDPIFCFILGTILLFYLPLLGFWLAMAAACLRVFEAEVYEKEQNRELDLVDSLINSDIQGQVVEKFEGVPSSPRQQTLESNVPTGMADDIHEHLKRRKAKQPPPQKG
jgi:hypothetical protein